MGRTISPVERLMREHGVLRRLLFIYEQCGVKKSTRTVTRTAGRPGARTLMSASHRVEVLAETAALIRQFIEEYHQTLEEEFVFPVLLQRNIEIKLVQTLLRQHHAARCMTGRMRPLLSDSSLRDAQNTIRLETYLQQYITLCTPHTAREDTVVLPLFRESVSDTQWDAINEQFEMAEVRRFGTDGFTGIVQRITLLEKTVSVHDLDQYTPECEAMPTTDMKHTK